MGNHFNWKAIGLHDDATAEVGQTIRVKAVDENKLPIEWETASAQVDWDEVTNKPFVKVGGDTLTWDGNTEGRFIAEGVFCKVSDAVPTMDDLANGFELSAIIAGVKQSLTFGVDGIEDNGAALVLADEMVLIVYKIDENSLFTETGVYFMNLAAVGTDGYISRFTIPGYTGFAKEQIDPKVLPDVSWSKVTNKPFVIEGTSDTLTWDGNTEGLVCVSDMVYKVSDVVPTIADLSNGVTYISSIGITQTVPAENIAVLPNGVIVAGAFFVPENAVGVEAHDVTFPESGIYFVRDSEEEYITSITIPGYTGFGTEVIDTKVLPEALQFGETTVASDTLEWNGNTEGLVSVDYTSELGVVIYKVSSAVPTETDFANGAVATLNGGAQITEGLVAIAQNGAILGAEMLFMVIPSDNYELDAGMTPVPEKGVYFAIAAGTYITSLTIPGYTGFTKTEIKPIEEKFIPDTVPTIQSATVGQTIRVSAVDENGVPTAWEAFDPFVLTDENTGTKYKLTVVDGKLTMTEVTV